MDKDAAWTNHLTEHRLLKEYSDAMKELHDVHWQKYSNEPRRCHSTRIGQIHSTVMKYFNNLPKTLEEDKIHGEHLRRFGFCDAEPFIDPSLYEVPERKLKVLDVGSSHDPFREFEEFDTTAIDLFPAVDTVHQADFLDVPIHDSPPEKLDPSKLQLVKNSFDAVVSSYVMTYLPCPEMRLKKCQKIYELLKPNGLYVIATPGESQKKVLFKWERALKWLGFYKDTSFSQRAYYIFSMRKHPLPDFSRLLLQKKLQRKMYVREHKKMEKELGRPVTTEEWNEKKKVLRPQRVSYTEKELVDMFTSTKERDEAIDFEFRRLTWALQEEERLQNAERASAAPV